VLLAGCGGGHKPCPVPPRLNADIEAIRNAPSAAAINHATDVFLHDVDTAPIDNLQRNRLIDHAAAALAGRCPQCFQALEADRPIPEIEQKGRAACR
jgi:hypothetical protein